MKTRTLTAVLLLSAIWVAGARLSASDPIGVYAVIEKIVFEPNDSAPERVQIWGAFAVSETENNDDYKAPQKGYLYYTCAPGLTATCANEWADLKSVAGKGVGVGYGGRRTPSGRIRAATEKPSAPDVYPIRMGVVRMGGVNDQRSIVAKLKAALSER